MLHIILLDYSENNLQIKLLGDFVFPAKSVKGVVWLTHSAKSTANGESLEKILELRFWNIICYNLVGREHSPGNRVNVTEVDLDRGLVLKSTIYLLGF